VESVPSDLLVLGVFGERVFDMEGAFRMRPIIFTTLGFSLFLLLAGSLQAVNKPRNNPTAAKAKNYPAVNWSCNVKLLDGSTPSIRGNFSKSSLLPARLNEPGVTSRTAVFSVDQDKQKLMGDTYGYMANSSFQDQKVIQYDLFGKYGDGFNLTRFDLSLRTKTGSIIIYKITELNDTKESMSEFGRGSCNVKEATSPPL
jgi:hypothetical protein